MDVGRADLQENALQFIPKFPCPRAKPGLVQNKVLLSVGSAGALSWTG